MANQMEDRRESARVDDTLIVQFSVLGSEGKMYANSAMAPLDPTDLLCTWRQLRSVREAASSGSEDEKAGVAEQLLLRVDWLLNEVLRAMSHLIPGQLKIPMPTNVNIGTNGIRFDSSTEVSVGDTLNLFVVLPIFDPIKCLGQVEWVRKRVEGDRVSYYIGASFLDISDHDKERITHYMFGRQAECHQEQSDWHELYKRHIARVMTPAGDDADGGSPSNTLPDHAITASHERESVPEVLTTP